MPRRLMAFLRGTDDALPVDYVFAMFCLLGVVLALITRIVI